MFGAAICGWLTTILAFWPGFLSPDSMDQLNQARTGVFTDWHPPILALIWRGLLTLTGTVGSMLVLQTAVLWSALWGLAMLVLRVSHSRRWSVATLALGMLPFVINISGVIWKDVHLANSLLAATVTALWLPRLRARKILFWVGVGAVILLLAYAIMVRKNALVAVPPLMVLLYRAWQRPQRRHAIGLVVALIVTTAAMQGVVTLVARPASSGMTQFIAVDDVVHAMTAAEIRDAGFSPDLERRLLEAQRVCQRDAVIFNAYLSCYPRDGGVDHGPELQSRWPGLMAQRPLSYLNYRLQAFSTYLFGYRVVWLDTSDPEQVGIPPRFPGISESLRMYISRADMSLGIVFVPALWLVLSLLLVLQRSARTRFGTASRMLGLSSILYIAAYFPVVPAVDFRYTYWPVIACCVGGVLYALERHGVDEAASDLGA